MVNNYIFVCSDTETIDGAESAYNVAMARLDKGLWPIYSGTRNKKQLKSGDKCLFYLAGKKENCQHIVAIAEIDEFAKWLHKDGSIDHEDIMSGFPEWVIRLKNIKFLKPVYIKDILTELSFIHQTEKSWGGAFQGGCKKISGEDYNLIINLGIL